jgi:hypothetical protein
MEGITNENDIGGSYEGVTRMLWGIGSWLVYPYRPSLVAYCDDTYDLEALMYRALVNGCNPDAAGYWGRTKSWAPHWDQQTVEAAQVAYAVWQTRDRIWAKMTSTEQGYVLDFLERFGQRPPLWTTNWALFWVLNHAGRKALNGSYDQAILDEVMFNYLDKVYCGDGWYVDAPQRSARHFDNYLTWGFAIHVLEWAMLDGAAVPERRDELLERVRLWMMHFPYFFASDGAYCEYGRSLCYKFGRLGAPVLAYKLGVWPHPVGMLKRLVGRHLRWYVDRGAIRDDGTLRQSLTVVGSPLIREHYISTGSSYWAMQVFCGLWSLPDDDPFWTVDEEPLPAEKSNYVKVFPQPGWVVTASEGQVTQFNAGSLDSSYQDKYAKLCYSTRTPFDIGDIGAASLDSSLCLRDNTRRATREYILCDAVNEKWLRSLYIVPLNGRKHLVDTTIVLLGNTYLVAHRVNLHSASKQVIGEQGSAPLGYNEGAVPSTRFEDGWSFVESGNMSVGIKPLRGYSHPTQIISGRSNIVYANSRVAVLISSPMNRRHKLTCLIYAGRPATVAQLPQVERAEWKRNGWFVAEVNGEIILVPPILNVATWVRYWCASSKAGSIAKRTVQRTKYVVTRLKGKLPTL